MKRIAVILAAVLVLVFVTGCGSPKQSVKMFLKYRVDNETDAAKLYCTDSVEDDIDAGRLTLQFLGFRKASGGSTSWASVKGSIMLEVESETEDSAVVVFENELGDIYFNLTHEGGMWKISSVDGFTGEFKEETLIEEA